MDSDLFKSVAKYIYSLQSEIAGHLEKVGEEMKPVKWSHPERGGGLSLSAEHGKNFFKTAVHVSEIGGTLSEGMKKTLSISANTFSACGLSLIFHPISPIIPTVHMNVRFFETDEVSWFGAVCDLTPYYPHVDDFVFFHKQIKEAVESVEKSSYEPSKKACDEYFTLPHRSEMRGVGGVFFDHLKEDHEKNFSLIKALGSFFVKNYFTIFHSRKNESYGEDEKLFQAFRHGRYVEFNLLYDRGTKFGLQSKGRVESILSSLPPHPYFPNDFDYSKNPIAKEMKPYYQPRDWII